MYGDNFNDAIGSVLDQLRIIKELYFVPMYQIDDKGNINKDNILFDWNSKVAKSSYMLLTERLNMLINKQHEVMKKKLKENTHE